MGAAHGRGGVELKNPVLITVEMKRSTPSKPWHIERMVTYSDGTSSKITYEEQRKLVKPVLIGGLEKRSPLKEIEEEKITTPTHMRRVTQFVWNMPDFAFQEV